MISKTLHMWNGAERVGDMVDSEKLYSMMLLKSGLRKGEGEKSKEEEEEDMRVMFSLLFP